MSQRSFTVERVENVHGKKLARFNGGRYLSSTPVGAAKKVVSHVCRSIDVHGQCTFIVTVRETTRSSLNKSYCYKIKRVLDPVIVEHDGVEIEHAYRIEAHAY
jgi:hypothetical protein